MSQKNKKLFINLTHREINFPNEVLTEVNMIKLRKDLRDKTKGVKMKFNLVEYDDATTEVKTIYDEFKRDLKVNRVPNWMKALGNHTPALKGVWEKTRYSFVQSTLPTTLKEIILFVVSVRNGAEYSSVSHAYGALQSDKNLDYDVLLNILDNPEKTKLPENFKSAIAFAWKMGKGPEKISDKDYKKLEKSGFKENEIREILSLIDLAFMYNVITVSHQVPMDEHYSDIRFKDFKKAAA